MLRSRNNRARALAVALAWAVLGQYRLSAAPQKVSAEALAAYQRGRRLYEEGSDMAGARAALDDAIRLGTDYGDAYLYRALVIDDGGGLALSRADFQRALALLPESKEAHRFYGESLATAGEIAAARAKYERALALDPDYPDVIYLLGRLLQRSGELDRAIALFEHHARVSPAGTAHHALAEIFLAREDRARAESELAADLKTDETCYESRINLAGLYLEHGDFVKARQQYETSLLYHPGDYRALAGLGRAALSLGDYEIAIADLRGAADLAPDDQMTRDALASARLHQRWRHGWRFAAIPGAIAVALGIYTLRLRRRLRREA